MVRHSKNGYSGKRVNKKRLVLYFIFIFLVLSITSLIQTSRFEIFGVTPAITFVLVCAVGFVYGEKSGAIFGLVGGILIDALGFSGVMISTILYTVLGYLCGRIVGWFLSKNLPSFAVYALIAGIIKGIFTLLVVGVISTDFDLLYVLRKIVLPEYFATVIFICPIYFIMAVIYRLFSLKDKKEFRF